MCQVLLLVVEPARTEQVDKYGNVIRQWLFDVPCKVSQYRLVKVFRMGVHQLNILKEWAKKAGRVVLSMRIIARKLDVLKIPFSRRSQCDCGQPDGIGTIGRS